MHVLLTILFLSCSLPDIESSRSKGSHRLEKAARIADKEIVNQKQLFETSEAYRNLTRDGVPQTRVVGIVSGVSAGFSILKGIAENVDLSRVCVVGLKNMGNRNLIQPEWYLAHGKIRQPLPRILPPKETGIFTFEKSSYAPTGTNGVLTYTIEGTAHRVVVSWSVPMLYAVYSNEFNVQVLDNVQANSTLLDFMEAHEDKLTVWDGGHWLTSKLGGVTVNGAMTNSAKASLLVELEYNLPSSIENTFG